MSKYSKPVEEKWRKIIDEFNRSGLTPVEFSRKRTFNINTFYTWRKRINSLSSPPVNSHFQEINLQDPPKRNTYSSSIDIFINDKIRISVTDDFNEVLLLKTLKVLNNAIC